MKRYIAIILALMMVISLAGCGTLIGALRQAIEQRIEDNSSEANGESEDPDEDEPTQPGGEYEPPEDIVTVINRLGTLSGNEFRSNHLNLWFTTPDGHFVRYTEEADEFAAELGIDGFEAELLVSSTDNSHFLLIGAKETEISAQQFFEAEKTRLSEQGYSFDVNFNSYEIAGRRFPVLAGFAQETGRYYFAERVSSHLLVIIVDFAIRGNIENRAFNLLHYLRSNAGEGGSSPLTLIDDSDPLGDPGGIRPPSDMINDPDAELEYLIPRSYREYISFLRHNGDTDRVGSKEGIADFFDSGSPGTRTWYIFDGFVTVRNDYFLSRSMFVDYYSITQGSAWANANADYVEHNDGHVGERMDAYGMFSFLDGMFHSSSVDIARGRSHSIGVGFSVHLTAFISLASPHAEADVFAYDEENGFISILIRHFMPNEDGIHREMAVCLSLSYDSRGNVIADGYIMQTEAPSSYRVFYRVQLTGD
jgi:predicted small lipoprotein YifL